MTDQELKDLVASLAASQRQTDQQLLANAEQLQEHAAYHRETAEILRQTDQQLKEQLKQTDQQLKEQLKQTDRQLKQTDRQIKELGKQIGGLGDKFGSFTEGLALPSMTRILNERFGMEVVAPRVRARNDGRSLEVDVLAFSKNRDDVFVVEVKSHLREDALEQMRKILREFHDFIPGHEGKKLYGILAAVDAPADVREKVLQEGIYLARVHDGHFELQVPDGFQPRAF